MKMLPLFSLLMLATVILSAQSIPSSGRKCPEALSLRELMTVSFTALVDLTVEEEMKGDQTYRTYFKEGKPFDGWAFVLNVQTPHKFHFYQIVEGISQREVGYYGSGQIDFDFNFRNQVLEGCRLMWFEDGSVYIDQFHLSGKPDGRQLRFNEEGEVELDVLYNNGVQVEQ